MLQNNQTLPADLQIDVLFRKMINEIPWNTMLLLLKSNSQLLKIVMSGGNRLDPKNRKRIEDTLCREGAKVNYALTYSGVFFAAWYPINKELHNKLETYFHSEDYKDMLKKDGAKDDVYFLTIEKFTEIFAEKDITIWHILWIFSPLTLSDEQVEKILSTKVEINKDVEKELIQLRQQNNDLNNQKNVATEQAKQNKAELVELKKKVAELSKLTETSQVRINSMQAENQKMRAQLADFDGAKEELNQAMQIEKNEFAAKMNKEIELSKQETDKWRKAYDQKCAEDKTSDRKLSSLKEEIEAKDQEYSKLTKTIAKQNKFANLIISHINWSEIGASLKMTPVVKKQFANLIKKMDYEDAQGVNLENSLLELWNSLGKNEMDLIKKIADSDNLEIAQDNASDFWTIIEDDFEDVYLSLEARMTLVKFLKSIFYDAINSEALDSSSLYNTIFKK